MTVHIGRATSRLETISAALPDVAGQSLTATELGAELSRLVGQVVPHDGYMYVGLDPLTEAGCFFGKENGYSTAASRRLERDDDLGGDVNPFRRLMSGSSQVGVLSADMPEFRNSARLRDVMMVEGFGSELRIVAPDRGVVWGALVLLRERDRRPFSWDEALSAQRLVPSLAVALRRFIGAKPLRPTRLTRPPGVVLVGANDQIASATPSGYQWLDELARDAAVDDGQLSGLLWNITYRARRATTEPVIARIPTPDGWVAMHAQPLQPGPQAEVAVTIQPAPASLLLPALAAWYGLTRREREILDQSVNGLPAKQIARALRLSQHTVHDHLKAIYHKTGVSGREELLAGITS
ncbi:helix-turn-helix transcriptional regulator [Streptoalloteichus hindustanus]|uniref:DNA-binding transcriptional regulator, CsgD family n=1 Tax=Streptoalloteichus hindustanus TaxID=2017 RepID=A0A1M5FD04_STRHI|nr:helix-turn-helix transcriptional regulator [Streptoalloteichus hindustanus]SHF89369.1 DNA-binding transcriptional regulator, CsgD family [Streptoalloteichus hindustanus]